MTLKPKMLPCPNTTPPPENLKSLRPPPPLKPKSCTLIFNLKLHPNLFDQTAQSKVALLLLTAVSRFFVKDLDPWAGCGFFIISPRAGVIWDPRLPERGNDNDKGGDSLCVLAHYGQFGARLLHHCFLEEPRCCDGFRLPVTALREKTMRGRSLGFSRSGSARVLWLSFPIDCSVQICWLVWALRRLESHWMGSSTIRLLESMVDHSSRNFPDRGFRRLWIGFQGCSWPGPMENKTRKRIQGAKEE